MKTPRMISYISLLNGFALISQHTWSSGERKAKAIIVSSLKKETTSSQSLTTFGGIESTWIPQQLKISQMNRSGK